MSFVDKFGGIRKKNPEKINPEKINMDSKVDEKAEKAEKVEVVNSEADEKKLHEELEKFAIKYSELEKENLKLQNENSELKSKYDLSITSLKQRAKEEIDNILEQNKIDIQNSKQNTEYDYSKQFISSIASEFDTLFRMFDDIKDSLSEKNKESMIGLRNKFEKAFAQVGVTFTMPKSGDTFDPEMHYAVSQRETTQYQRGQIVEAMSSCWKIDDRTVKTALVIVAQ